MRLRACPSLRTSRLLAALGPALLVACATARTPSTARDTPLATQVQAPGLLFEVLYTPPDAGELARIERGLLSVGPRLSRWGSFRQGVHIRVFPDHEALETAVDRRGYPWLRAWAFGDQVLLPSVTAEQGHRRFSSEELSRWLAAHPGADVMHPSAELYRTEKEAVYGAAHRAFDLLLRLSGDQAVRELLRGMREGVRFADSFQAATGLGLADFERDAVRSGFDPAAKAAGAGGP